MEPLFKIGQKVRIKKDGKVFKVVDRELFPAIATHAIKVHANGETSLSPTTIAEHWIYRLDDGKSWRHAENLLEAAE